MSAHACHLHEQSCMHASNLMPSCAHACWPCAAQVPPYILVARPLQPPSHTPWLAIVPVVAILESSIPAGFGASGNADELIPWWRSARRTAGGTRRQCHHVGGAGQARVWAGVEVLCTNLSLPISQDLIAWPGPVALALAGGSALGGCPP